MINKLTYREAIKELKKGFLYQNSQMLFPYFSERDSIFYSSFLGLMLGVAWADRLIRTGEVRYLVGFLQRNFKLPKEDCLKIIDLNIFNMKVVKQNKKLFPYFEYFIRTKLRTQMRVEFLTNLMVLGSADGDLHSRELRRIKKIAAAIDLTPEHINQSQIAAKKLIKRKEESLAKAPKKEDYYDIAKGISQYQITTKF